jgi:hypothetical protein
MFGQMAPMRTGTFEVAAQIDDCTMPGQVTMTPYDLNSPWQDQFLIPQTRLFHRWRPMEERMRRVSRLWTKSSQSRWNVTWLQPKFAKCLYPYVFQLRSSITLWRCDLSVWHISL